MCLAGASRGRVHFIRDDSVVLAAQARCLRARDMRVFWLLKVYCQRRAERNKKRRLAQDPGSWLD